MLDFIDKFYRKYHSRMAREQTKYENESYWNSAIRHITPVTIEEHRSGQYVIINKTKFARCIIVGIPPHSLNGYPPGMDESIISELIGLYTFGNQLTLSLKLIPIDTETVTKTLKKAMFVNQVAQEESKSKNKKESKKVSKEEVTNLIDMDLQLDKRHITENYEITSENKEKNFHTALIITFKSNTEDGLFAIESSVTSILNSKGVRFEIPDYQQKQTYIASQPFNICPDYTQVQMLTPYAATLTCARNVNTRSDDNGLFFGYDRYTNKTILVDLDKLAAQHLLGVGATQSGKTYTLLLLLMRAHSMLNRRIIYCTPKADNRTNHRAVIDYLGDEAELIDIGINGHNINPLQILYDRTQMKDNINEYINIYNNHKAIITRFLDVWFKDTGSINMSNFIDYSLNKIYENAGIYRDIPSTWHNAKWPVMNDLIKFWESELKIADKEDRKTIKAILNKTFSLGEGGILSYMNRPTDIDLSKNFILFDLSFTPEIIKDAMYVLITGIMSQRFRTDTKKSTIIAIDEARVFLENPQLSKFLMTTLTQGASHKIALWLLTQQATDFIKNGVDSEFQNNTYIKLILGNNIGKDNIKPFQDYFNLDSTNSEHLISAGVGEGLLIVGSNKTPIVFKPTKLEHSILKGAYSKSEKKETDVELLVESSEINTKLIDTIIQEGFCLNEWNPNQNIIKNWSKHRVANIFGAGLINAYINENSMPTNQSIDHFSSVLQIASHLILHDVEDVKIDHYNTVDISFKIDDQTWGLEYEIEGSHSPSELIKKKTRAQSNYNNVIFVCSSTYYKKLSQTLGEDFVIKRGITLKEFIESII